VASFELDILQTTTHRGCEQQRKAEKDMSGKMEKGSNDGAMHDVGGVLRIRGVFFGVARSCLPPYFGAAQRAVTTQWHPTFRLLALSLL
jgi:hypothetical protein